jgi:hypothetical protein
LNDQNARPSTVVQAAKQLAELRDRDRGGLAAERPRWHVGSSAGPHPRRTQARTRQAARGRPQRTDGVGLKPARPRYRRSMEEELEELREATLRRLSLQPTGTAGYTFEVVATVPGPKDEPLEGPMRESLASHLAVRVEKALRRRRPRVTPRWGAPAAESTTATTPTAKAPGDRQSTSGSQESAAIASSSVLPRPRASSPPTRAAQCCLGNARVARLRAHAPRRVQIPLRLAVSAAPASQRRLSNTPQPETALQKPSGTNT